MSSFNWNKILAALIAAVILLPALAESQRPKRKTVSPTTMKADAVKVDTLKKDSLAQDTVGKKKKTSLNAPVQYSADDSIVFTHDGYAHLYGNGKASYQYEYG
jgi:hypothetical protein